MINRSITGTIESRRTPDKRGGSWEEEEEEGRGTPLFLAHDHNVVPAWCCKCM